jgi:hypothetical protein
MEAVLPFEMALNFYRTVQRHIPEHLLFTRYGYLTCITQTNAQNDKIHKEIYKFI